MSLPFGQTRTTVAEIREVIQPETAVEILDDLGCEYPSSRVGDFVEAVPDLLLWLENNGRVYPWRQTTDPWRVYISEILLQRTRGDLVESIYSDFFDRFPDPQALHEATENEIYETVQPLGFGNHRTTTLQEVAELVHSENRGDVPQSEDELRQPWRVGPYSARACLIFAFHRPLSLVDSNFARVIERVFGCDLPQQPHKSEEIYSLMSSLMPEKPALSRAFNLAILDIGALVCTPSSPDCGSCPLSSACLYSGSAKT